MSIAAWLVCQAKVAYATAAEAHVARMRMAKRDRRRLGRRRRRRKVYVYRCPICRQFHLATPGKRKEWEES